MSMLPPLVCDTPPPIDADTDVVADFDDEFGGDFDTNASTHLEDEFDGESQRLIDF